jgi:hypothetical protein
MRRFAVVTPRIWRGISKTGRALREAGRACQLLIIDVFGTGLYSPVAWGIVGEILAERCDRQAPTILTTNFDQRRIDTGHPPSPSRLLAGIVCRLPGGKGKA